MAISSSGPEALLGQSESDSIGTRMKNPPSLIREGVTPSSQETQGASEAKSVAQLGIEVRQRRPERAHKTRAIFDRYNIINEQKLLEAGDQGRHRWLRTCGSW